MGNMGISDDTIAAIATPVGMGGIGIIKISGPRALAIATQIFRPYGTPPLFKSHHLYCGEIFDSREGNALDEALLSFMAKPRSYTREDVVEINCHSGYLVLQEILALAVGAGARLAEPGEFTKRAFLNGRIDLAQAEAVADLIESKTALSLTLATGQLKGTLSQEINSLKEGLVELLSTLEASIDFPEEDLEGSSLPQLVAHTDHLIPKIEKLLNTYKEGRLYREGVSAIIAGKPNVGKSSLFNALLGEERTIVTPEPGTTRDFIEEVINFKGIPLKIIDTAGLRDPKDSIEKEGVRITRDKLDRADLALLVIDGSLNLDNEDEKIFNTLNGKKVVVACNKTDLPRKVSLGEVKGLLPASPVVLISALYKTGIEELKEVVFSLCVSHATSSPSCLLISNLRHKLVLEKALASTKSARESLQKRVPHEFTASDLQAALHSLGEITGQTSSEEILDQIFSRFCIGK
jgi:tRNA modification GTPase